MSDCLNFNQGQLATLTAQFVTSPAGAPVDVPDATIQIIGPGASEVLAATAMERAFTGFYFYDWAIPNSLAPNTYTIRYTGTVAGTLAAATDYIKIWPAGTPGINISQNQVELIAALSVYLGCAQNVPVYRELARMNESRDVARLTWPRWNLGNHVVFKSEEQVTSGYTIDGDTGTIRFTTPLHETDIIDASYNFRMFSDTDLLRFLNDALSQINIQAPGTSWTLDTFPISYAGILMMGAAKNAIMKMLMCLQFQEPSTIFGGPDRSKDVFSNLSQLKENYEKQFGEEKKQIKRSVYPRAGMIVTPVYTLPGGRSRWFRYLFSSGMG